MNDDALVNFLHGMAGPVDTGWLAESAGVDRREMFNTLNRLANEGRLVRSFMFLENGTPRPTIGFGWSCPAAS